MKTESFPTHLRVELDSSFDADKVFDCGQCFRFSKDSDSVWRGVAFGRLLELKQVSEKELIIFCTEAEFNELWMHYLALDCDYGEIDRVLLDMKDSVMDRAVESGRGIRLLRQEPWEALCSFIISQNNNIPRIKGIIERMCEKYGEPVCEKNGRVYYSFPTARALYDAGVEGLFSLKTGFRAGYIHNAADKVCHGGLDLEGIFSLDTESALETLCTLKGVGPKVGACALLFGFDKTDAFPIDVWVKRVLAKYYPDGFDYKALGRSAGMAQQYLFYYERYLGA